VGIIFSGDGDINFVGVVGSTRDDTDDTESSETTDQHDDERGTVNTGIRHLGRGQVWINSKRQR
jgi:hypothetical protein